MYMQWNLKTLSTKDTIINFSSLQRTSHTHQNLISSPKHAKHSLQEGAQAFFKRPQLPVPTCLLFGELLLYHDTIQIPLIFV